MGEDEEIMAPKAKVLGKSRAAKGELARQPIVPTPVVLSLADDQSITPSS